MSALATRKGHAGILSAAMLLAIAIPFGIAGPAHAAPPGPNGSSSQIAKYVALGDSYAAGQGGGDYIDPVCLQSPHGYAAQLDAVSGINLLRNGGCSGATVADVQSNQLGLVNRGTTLVTLTVGANDLGVGSIWALCTDPLQAAACQTAVATAGAKIASGSIGTGVGGLIAAVKARAPSARVVVTGYPLPFDAAYAAAWAAYTGDPLLVNLNVAVGQLNAQLAAAAASSAAEWVDPTLAFATHGAGCDATLPTPPVVRCDDGPWLGSDPADPVSFLHPTAEGYAVYRELILAALS
ncbi:SGNH/GDSL hydrolase family protein [Agromyces soli]